MLFHEKIVNYFNNFGECFLSNRKKDGKPFYKSYIELLLARAFLLRLPENKSDYLSVVISTIDDFIGKSNIEKEFSELAKKDHRWLVHCVGYDIAGAGQIGHPLREQLSQWSQAQSFLGYDGTFFTQLEKAYICQKSGLSSNKKLVHRATKATLEVTFAELERQISRDAVYVLTHIIFYLTDFGFNVFPLTPVPQVTLYRLLIEVNRLIPLIFETGHFDAYAELGLCALFLGDLSSAQEVFNTINKLYDNGWKAHRDLPKNEDDDKNAFFFQTYHSTLVVCMLSFGCASVMHTQKIPAKIRNINTNHDSTKLINFEIDKCFNFNSPIYPSLISIKAWHSLIKGETRDFSKEVSVIGKSDEAWKVILDIYQNGKSDAINGSDLEKWVLNEFFCSGHSYGERLMLNLFAEALGINFKDPFKKVVLQWFCESETSRRCLPKLMCDFFPLMWVYRLSWLSVENKLRNKSATPYKVAFTVFNEANPQAWIEQKWKISNQETQNVIDELASFAKARVKINSRFNTAELETHHEII